MKNKATKENGYISGWDAMARQLSQGAAGYNPYGAGSGKGCANCHWWVASENACVIVAGDIVATGMSDMYRAKEVYDPNDPKNALPVRLVAVDFDEVDKVIGKKDAAVAAEGAVATVTATTSDSVTVTALQRVVDHVKGWFTDKKEVKPFWTVRDVNGRLRFFLIYTNGFKDKHSEFIASAAHKEYAEWTDETKIYPELQLWHGGPGARVGMVDNVDFIDGFGLSSGLIDKEWEAVVEKAAEQNLGVSHGFIGIKNTEGDTWTKYRDFEHTILPAEHAANVWTAVDFVTLKEKGMPLSDTKKAWYKGLGMPDSAIATVETRFSEMTDALKSLGIEYKEDGTAAADSKTPVKIITDGPVTVTPQPNPPAQPPPQPTQPVQNPGVPTEPAAKAVGANSEAIGVSQKDLVELLTTVNAQGTVLTAMAKELASLKKSDDEKIAAQFGARNAPGVGTRPSQDPANVTKEVGNDVTRKDAEFWQEQMNKIFEMGNAPVAGSG